MGGKGGTRQGVGLGAQEKLKFTHVLFKSTSRAWAEGDKDIWVTHVLFAQAQ